MISRAYIHVAGCAGVGKTTLIEAFLRATDASILVARGRCDARLKHANESVPRGDNELRRYRNAGASGVAVYAFPPTEPCLDDFFETDSMLDYSEAVIIEGDAPERFGDPMVYVARPLSEGASLFVRVQRDRAGEERTRAAAMRQLIRQPDGVQRFLSGMIGPEVAELAGRESSLLDEARETLLATLEKADRLPPSKPTEHWSVASGYEGIEHAQVVSVNLQRARDTDGATRLIEDLRRLRQDQTLFDDVLGWRESKVPITAVAADLSDPKHPGTKKLLARLRRSVRAASRLAR